MWNQALGRVWEVFQLSHFSHVQLSATLWTVALQGPLSIEFSRQEYWSELWTVGKEAAYFALL